MSKNDSVEVKLERILSEFVEKEKETVAECVMQAGKFAKREVQARSPGDGSYKKGWRVRNKRRSHTIETVVYNATDPSLTHLLEKSHVIRNQFGTYGRSRPVEHIKPAQEAAEQYLMDLLKPKL